MGNALMSNWFSHFRGIAFGLANSGNSFAGMLLPLVALYMIDNFSLQTTYFTFGIATCLFAPLCWIVIRDTPSALHLHADGRKHDPRRTVQNKINTNIKNLLLTPAVWYIGVSFGLALMAGVGLTSQLKPRFSDLGITPYTAMILASISAFSGTAAKYFWGFLCDKASPVTAARLIMLVFSLSFVFLELPTSIWSLGAFGVSFAFCSGGLWVALPAVTASFFGAANFLGVYRIISIFIILRCVGFPIMGFSHDQVGNYDLADLIFFISLLISLLLTLLLKNDKSLKRH